MPGGHGTFFGFLNSGVHVVMYMITLSSKINCIGMILFPQVHLLLACCHRSTDAEIFVVEEILDNTANDSVCFGYTSFDAAVLSQSMWLSINLLLHSHRLCNHVLLLVSRFTCFFSSKRLLTCFLFKLFTRSHMSQRTQTKSSRVKAC
jgi:hypothetical protein